MSSLVRGGNSFFNFFKGGNLKKKFGKPWFKLMDLYFTWNIKQKATSFLLQYYLINANFKILLVQSRMIYFVSGAFKKLVDISFVCAMGPPGGGRNPVTSRMLRHFNYISCLDMSPESKSVIFSCIVKGWLGELLQIRESCGLVLQKFVQINLIVLFLLFLKTRDLVI